LYLCRLGKAKDLAGQSNRILNIDAVEELAKIAHDATMKY
jgi:hypothetical protein